MKTRKAIMSYTTRRNLSVWVLSMHGGYWIPTSALTARSIFALRTRVRLISSSSDRGPVSESRPSTSHAQTLTCNGSPSGPKDALLVHSPRIRGLSVK